MKFMDPIYKPIILNNQLIVMLNYLKILLHIFSKVKRKLHNTEIEQKENIRLISTIKGVVNYRQIVLLNLLP